MDILEMAKFQIKEYGNIGAETAKALIEENARLQSIIDEANAQEPCFEVGRHGRSGDYFVTELKTKAKLCKGMKLYANPLPGKSIPEKATSEMRTAFIETWLENQNRDDPELTFCLNQSFDLAYTAMLSASTNL